jgi:hypothetical protein
MTYKESRMDFIGALSTQTSPVTGEELFDPRGTITRMAARGETKERIKEELEKMSTFNVYVEKMKNPETDDPMEKYMIDGFADFYETLENLENPENAPSLREETAKVLLSKYPDAKKAADLALNKGTATEIFNALDEVPAWVNDSKDYLTRDDVEVPTDRQKFRWARFSEIVDHINDIDLYI